MDSINNCTTVIPFNSEVVLEHSMNAQRRDYDYFGNYWKGDIVVLVGTSTAGKTSIIKALCALDSNRVEDGSDLRSDRTDLRIAKQRNPIEVELLETVFKDPLDIPKAIMTPERNWRSGVSAEDRAKAELAIRRIGDARHALPDTEKDAEDAQFVTMELEMIDDALELSRKGVNVVFDALNVDVVIEQIARRNFHGPVRLVLTYCPFRLLTERMKKRTSDAIESGEYSNVRIGEFPLVQFSDLYTACAPGEPSLERLTRKQVVDAFDENFNLRAEARRREGQFVPAEDQLSQHRDELLQRMLNNLGFRRGVETVDVGPRNLHQYQWTINTSRLGPDLSAFLLHQDACRRY